MKQVGNTILAKGVNHILAKRDNPAWPKGSKLSGFSTVGVCGGFTTFSTFMNENYRLMKSDSMLWMAFYAASSLFVGLLCVWLGYKAMR